MTNAVSLALIGCGKMGSALLRGWLNADLIHNSYIYDPNGIDNDLAAFDNVHHITSYEAIPFDQCAITILAVKPQIMKAVCSDLKPHLPYEQVILSIAAGTSLLQFAEYLSYETPVIRTMPNTPAAIGKGMTALFANNHVKAEQKATATQLMEAAGQVTWLEREEMMDAVTAISGSGPAYLFHMIEVLQESAIELGFDNETAEKLARQTIIGAAALADDNSETTASTLRQNVTSPGGTTEAALNILMNGELQDIMNQTVKAAEARGKELSES